MICIGYDVLMKMAFSSQLYLLDPTNKFTVQKAFKSS